MEPLKKTKEDIILFEVENFLTHEECDYFIGEINKLQLERGGIANAPWEKVNLDDVRVAKTKHLPRTEISEKLRRRIEDFVGSVPYSAEGVVAIKYDHGDFFKLHSDYFNHYNVEMTSFMSSALNRIKTAIIYLNDDFDGGETTFPYIDTIIKPVKGKMVAWQNGESNGVNYVESQHTGEEVKNGTKYILTFWMHVGPMQDPIFEEPKPEIFSRSKSK